MLRPVIRRSLLASVVLLSHALGLAPARAVPDGPAPPVQGGVLRGHAQDEPGGFRLDPPPGPAEKPLPKSVERPPPAAPPSPAPSLVPSAHTTQPAPRNLMPGYVSLGLSAVFGILGTAFAVNTAAAMDDFPTLRRGQVVNANFETQLEEAQTAVLVNGLVTSVLFSACVSSLIVGTMYLVAE